MASREKKKNLSGNAGDTGKHPAKGVFIALVLFLLAGVWGCSGSEPSSPDSSSPSQQGETGMTESQMNKILAKEGLLEEAYSYVTPSSILSAESDSIWYLIDQDAFEKGKDSAIRVAYVCRDGAFRRYALNEDYTLGKFAKMSDEEIISELENLQGPLNESLVEVQQNLTTELQCLQPWLQSEKVIVSRETPFSMFDKDGCLALDKHVPAKINFICDTKQFSDLLGEYAENLSALEEWFKTDNGKISGQKLAVFTDSTGNAVSSERLTLEYTSPTLLNISETLSNYDSREAFAEFQLEHLFDKTVDYTFPTSP